MGQTSYLLAWFNQSDIDWLLTVSQKKSINTGTYILQERERSPYLFILIEGLFGIETSRKKGSFDIKLGPGEILGEMSFIDNSLPSASVKALENATVLAIDKGILEEKLNSDKDFAARFFRAISAVLANRLRETMNPSTSSPKPPSPNLMDVLGKI